MSVEFNIWQYRVSSFSIKTFNVAISYPLFLKVYFELEDNCFSVLSWILAYSNMKQPQVNMCPLLLEPPSHLSPHPTALGCHRAPDWARCIIQHVLAGYLFTYGNVYVSVLCSQFIPPSLSPLCPQLSSLYLHLSCYPSDEFSSTIFLSSIYMR